MDSHNQIPTDEYISQLKEALRKAPGPAGQGPCLQTKHALSRPRKPQPAEPSHIAADLHRSLVRVESAATDQQQAKLLLQSDLQTMREYKDRLSSPPDSFEKPKFGTMDYALAVRLGWITKEEEGRDRLAYHERRNRSLATCDRPSPKEPRRLHPVPAETGEYVPELSAHLQDHPNINDGARRCAAKIVAKIYSENRAGRCAIITVPYLMNALGRARNTVQKYLRQLERADFISTEVVRSDNARMCIGNLITLERKIFPRHHRKKWPAKAKNSGASKYRHNYRRLEQLRRMRVIVPVAFWTLRCMNGVQRAFMQTHPLELMEKSQT